MMIYNKDELYIISKENFFNYKYVDNKYISYILKLLLLFLSLFYKYIYSLNK